MTISYGKSEKMQEMIIFAVIFLLGFLTALLLVNLPDKVEYPLSYLKENLSYFKQASDTEYFSDFLSERDILVYPDRVVIKLHGATISSYESTGSMLPVLHEKANGIRIKPSSPEDVRVGDIISFKKDGSLIVHRVIKKGVDEKGVYFITKGDNNSFPDGKIRFEDIEYITVGIIY